jgi:hypothetical protein
MIMKKFAFIIGIIALFAFSVQAQDVTLSRSATNFNVTLDAGDTISNNSTTLSKTIGIGAKAAVQLYGIQVTLDSISGTPTEAVVLAGSMDNSNWATITTVNWAGTSSDTTFVYTDVSTGVVWPYLRVHITESGTAKAQLTSLRGKIVDKGK